MLLTVTREMRLISVVGLVLIALSPELCAQSHSIRKKQPKRQLSETMAKVRNGKTVNSRTDAAEHLETLTRRINPHAVDETTLTAMVSLLDTQEDSVRGWVAASLGNLGPRAKVAVPRLLKLLPEVDCLRGSLTSASAIRLALQRMGEIPPPRPKCDWRAGTKLSRSMRTQHNKSLDASGGSVFRIMTGAAMLERNRAAASTPPLSGASRSALKIWKWLRAD
jgi:hypothetical protein